MRPPALEADRACGHVRPCRRAFWPSCRRRAFRLRRSGWQSNEAIGSSHSARLLKLKPRQGAESDSSTPKPHSRGLYFLVDKSHICHTCRRAGREDRVLEPEMSKTGNRSSATARTRLQPPFSSVLELIGQTPVVE